MAKKVFVSGVFDLLHNGHILFFKEAAKFGDLYVSIGSDKTVLELKGKLPINSEIDRLSVIKELRFVKEAFIAKGSGYMDFINELIEIHPDIFIVNRDGDRIEKRELCKELSIEYIVLERTNDTTPEISTTNLRKNFTLPYVIELTGKEFEKPEISCKCPGGILTISIEPLYKLNYKQEFGIPERNKALRIWKSGILQNDEENAKLLFSYNNPPGISDISGSLNSIGIVMPGINYLFYNGKYWPQNIEGIKNPAIVQWLENIIYIVPIKFLPLSLLKSNQLATEQIKVLRESSEYCYKAIKEMNINELEKWIKKSFEIRKMFFPGIIENEIIRNIENLGIQSYNIIGNNEEKYIICISEKPVSFGFKVKIAGY